MTDDLSGEEFRPIPGFESRYEISRNGHVRSLVRAINHGFEYRATKQVGDQLLRPIISHGRGNVALPCEDWRREGGPRWKSQRKCSVIRLVYLTWVGPIPEGYVIREVDDGRDLADRLVAVSRGLNIRLNSLTAKARENAQRELARLAADRPLAAAPEQAESAAP